jgi:hypothetical protein
VTTRGSEMGVALIELGQRGLVRVVTRKNSRLEAALELVRDHPPPTGMEAPVMYEDLTQSRFNSTRRNLLQFRGDSHPIPR